MVIAVRVDLDTHSIKFYLNDKQKGKTINIDKVGVYYPTISYWGGHHWVMDADTNIYAQYQLLKCD